jgi:hypothetical protein
MVAKVHVLPLSKAFPLYLENILCHIQLKCLEEERENLESLGMYGGPWIRLIEKSCWPCATLVSLNLVPTARSNNAIQYIMFQTS